MTRLPKATWAQFLDCAPDFLSVLWANEECFTADIHPLVRALSFYDNFEARVSRDGVPAYFYFSEYVTDFASAPKIVAAHPLLSDAAALMREVFENVDFVTDVLRVVTERRNAQEAERRHAAFIRDFDDRAFALFEKLRPTLNGEVLRNLETYVVLEQPENLAGVGAEMLEVAHEESRWSARFEDGFPIGPNFREKGFVHFSADRLRVEYYAFGARNWADFCTGEIGKVTSGSAS